VVAWRVIQLDHLNGRGQLVDWKLATRSNVRAGYPKLPRLYIIHRGTHLTAGFGSVTNSQADATIAPSLKALGGWVDAPWFSPSVLSDNEVVGFQLPALPGVRKQSFQITDRSTSENSSPRKAANAPAKPPKRIAGRLSSVLDGFGATKAVACCRSRFLFESAPILFFAEIPPARLKPRSANKLRRELIEIGVSGCVVSTCGPSVIAMFWPTADDAISNFVQAATPDYPIHIDFFKPPPSERPPGLTDKASAKGRSTVNVNDRERKLLREISALRQQIDSLQQSQSAIAAMEKLGLDDARLRSMLTLLHPDRHGGSEAANEAAKWINSLRDLLKGKQA
jgi:hypothetical protein